VANLHIPHLEITIPVLNEQQTLQANVSAILAYIDAHIPPEKVKITLVIADNGSTDATPELAQAIVCKAGDRVNYVQIPRKGVGLALKTVWSASTADVVGYFDLDLATDLKHLHNVIDELIDGSADVLYATRLHPRANVQKRSFKRAFVSRVFNGLLKLYLNVHFSDGMCGFKFLRRKWVPQLLAAGAQADGWFFATEVLVTAEWLGANIKELPVTWTDDPDSRVKIVSLSWSYLKAMRRLRGLRPLVAQGKQEVSCA
jgi:glycosyltransferase involved in cell wall biosynthesis